MEHPYGELIGLRMTEQRAGFSRCVLSAGNKHLNPHQAVHGAILYAMADTGMGMALYPTLAPGEICATIQITMNYFRPVHTGLIVCTTEVVNRGRTLANLESRLFVDDVLVASASGNYAIFVPRERVD